MKWTITSKTRSHMNSFEHVKELRAMINSLDETYKKCEEEREFSKVYNLLSAFRDIIMVWPMNDFTLAYEELSDWQDAYLGYMGSAYV